jgi:integrase
MGRRPKGARLYLDPARGEWAIRDGAYFQRTGTADRNTAERLLGRYIAGKYEAPSDDPLIDHVLRAYATAKGTRDIGYAVERMRSYWGAKRVSQINARLCEAYKDGKGRRELQTLRAAVRYWHKHHAALRSIPVVVLPPAGAPRERWLSRSEAGRLLWASRRVEHLKRFVLIGLATGSRAGVIFSLRWSWVNFQTGVILRRAPGEREIKSKRRPPVRVSKRLLSFLRRWQEADGAGPDGYVVHFEGRKITHLRRSWQSAVIAAGLGPDVIPHCLRQSRATWLCQRGVPFWEIAGHLGMSVTVLQQVYGHHHPDYQRRAADI